MDQFFAMSNQERSQIYQEAAARSKDIKSPIIFEKDLWVCWTLKKIFTLPEINPHITFKGGTSLSKCFNMINRFSEDCDLVLSKDFLETNENTDLVASMSSKQKKKLLATLTQKSESKVNDIIKPTLIAQFRKELSSYHHDDEWKIETDIKERQNLLFHYPSTFTGGKSEYIQSTVKLEFGARGDTTPNEEKSISPYVYSTFPELFDNIPKIHVKTLTAKRTFWEKVTLLHAEHHRKSDNPPRARIFRHYYDITMLDNAGVTEAALRDTELLDIVVKNKQTFFPSGWAHYETAKIGSMCLLPADIFKTTLEQDCKKMADMFFGEPPDFNKVMNNVRIIQEKINCPPG